VPTIITATQLRGVLGVSSALYNDAYLNQIIDSAEAVILPMLVSYDAPIGGIQLVNNKATVYTVSRHPFNKGQSVVISGVGTPYNGTRTITSVNFDRVVLSSTGSLIDLRQFDNGDSYTTFTFDLTNADIEFRNVIPSGRAVLSGAATYVGNPAVESAIYVVSTEIFQSRSAAGGQIEGVDFAPTPYRMGRSLLNRVSGLLAPFMDEGTLCQ
jgi:hypothetical protein